MHALDLHHHLEWGGTDGELFRVPARRDFADWLTASCPTATVDGCLMVLQPPSFYVLTEGIEDTRRLNDLVGAASARRSGRVAAMVGTVEPHHGDVALAEIDRIAAELGFRGVVWRPRAQGVFADTPVMSAFVGRAADRGLVPMLHAGPRSGNEALWRVWRLAEQFPSVRIVVLGALSGWDQLQAVLAQPERATNVVYDTSSLFGEAEQIAVLAARVGVERLAFGSGSDCDDPVDADRAARRIAESELPDSIKRAVLWENSARLFGIIDAAAPPTSR